MAVIDEALERANRNWVRDEDKAHERGDAMALATEVDRLRSRLYYIELIAAKAKGRRENDRDAVVAMRAPTP